MEGGEDGVVAHGAHRQDGGGGGQDALQSAEDQARVGLQAESKGGGESVVMEGGRERGGSRRWYWLLVVG